MQARLPRMQGLAAFTPLQSISRCIRLSLNDSHITRSAAQLLPRRGAKAIQSAAAAGGSAAPDSLEEEVSPLRDREESARESAEALLQLLQASPPAFGGVHECGTVSQMVTMR